MNLPMDFIAAVNSWRRLRARFDQRQVLKHEFELLIRFEEETYKLFGLYQQVIVGNVNVPKLNYMDPKEESWMWSWIHGNRKWHAWNKCKGLTKRQATVLFIQEVSSLKHRLSDLVEQWKDEQDSRVPDTATYVPEDERENRLKMLEEAKKARRERDALKRAEEEAKGWWNE